MVEITTQKIDGPWWVAISEKGESLGMTEAEAVANHSKLL